MRLDGRVDQLADVRRRQVGDEVGGAGIDDGFGGTRGVVGVDAVAGTGAAGAVQEEGDGGRQGRDEGVVGRLEGLGVGEERWGHGLFVVFDDVAYYVVGILVGTMRRRREG